MFIIFLFTVLGFLMGLILVMKKRKIRPGAVLLATFLGLVSAAALKALKNYLRSGGKGRFS